MIAALAFRNVLRNKERSLLTLVGVVLAIGSFVALVSLAAGFTKRVERELGSREVHIYVTGSRTSTLPVSPLAGAGGSGVSLPHELKEILKVPGVRSVAPVIRSSLDGPRSVIPVIALPFDQVQIVFKGGQFSSEPGKLEPKPASVVLGTRESTPEPETTPTASATPDSEATPGPETTVSPSVSPSPVAEDQSESDEGNAPPPMSDDTLIYPALIGQDLQQDVAELQRGGVLVIEELPFLEGGSMGSHGFLDYSVIAPIDAFFDQRPDRGVHEFWLTLDDEKQADAIKQQLDAKLDEYLDAKQATGEYTGARRIKVLTRRQYLASAQEYLGYGWLLQVAVSMVGVLIAVTASMNTMLMSTYERLGEYATLRAVGASRRVISMTILYEATFLNVTGGVIGLFFGTLATGVLDKAVGLILEIPYPMAGITPMLLLQALGLSFCVGIVGAVIPCFIVSRIDLVEQLRKGL
ncbi:MAG: ABC transporter permease [Candidatus Eremiobacteraeota bacterium]|nr:ABC transporter permease [Candidatus Eremiobacteraeota bacterium]